MHPRDARIILICGLGYGDEGKGSIVDYLTRSLGATLVVRYNGGPQAAHHVVTDDGVTHCFSQFGSGTLVPGVRTFLSRFMLVDPPALLNEADALARIGITDAPSRLTIDRNCILVTPYHASMNRIRELARGAGRHGTCGRGVGEAVFDAEKSLSVRAGDVESAALPGLIDKIRRTKKTEAAAFTPPSDLSPEHREQWEREMSDLNDLDPGFVADLFRKIPDRGIRVADSVELIFELKKAVTIFEGAQGVLLDRDFGFFPHVSPTRTTFANADVLLGEAGIESGVCRIGVTRSYMTRHGEGPFVSENPRLERAFRELHNENSGWQGKMRTGDLDLVALRYATGAVGRLDGIAVTHLDGFDPHRPVQICNAYRPAGADGARLKGTESERTIARSANPTPQTQEALTQKLLSSRPELTEIPAGEFTGFVARENGVPVVIESRGPAAGMKRFT